MMQSKKQQFSKEWVMITKQKKKTLRYKSWQSARLSLTPDKQEITIYITTWKLVTIPRYFVLTSDVGARENIIRGIWPFQVVIYVVFYHKPSFSVKNDLFWADFTLTPIPKSVSYFNFEYFNSDFFWNISMVFIGL